VAKIKVSPHPRALSELLKKKGMTQTDAFEKTRVDRKTLRKIDRGEEVKLETLQQVANKLQVTEEYFRHPPAEATDDSGGDPEPGTIMLRKLDAARLEQLFRADPSRLEWQLNAQVPDDEARKFLEDFETVVENFRRDLFLSDDKRLSLRHQLERLKTADEIAARLERLAEHRLALLGADHLFWKRSYKQGIDRDWGEWFKEEYSSSNIVLLSVEPFGTQSRRAHVSIGEPPPLFAPDPETDVYVNGERLPSLEEL
jgi:transcriptional regulator with XRE-family HTH domain